MKRGLLSILVVGLLGGGLLVAGCAARFEADVTRFNDMAAVPQGQSVAVVAKNQNLDKSIEFERYAAEIQDRLLANGFTTPHDGETPAIFAEVDYGVGEGKAALRDNDNPVSVGVGVAGGSRGGLGVGLSTGFGLGGGSSSGTHMRYFTLVLSRAEDGRRIFEGRVLSEGKSADLAPVMPLMIDAMFENFPGANGETRSISRDMP